MLGAPSPVTATVQTNTSAVTPSSPRPSRLRGFSLLRSYTQNHWLTSPEPSPRSRSTSRVSGERPTSIVVEPRQETRGRYYVDVRTESACEISSSAPASVPPMTMPTMPSLPHRNTLVEGASSTAGAASASRSSRSEQEPVIRFIPHMEPRAARPSLQFPAVERRLTNAHSVLRVGRYSDRDNDPSALSVGFKSKVVSRRHCEFSNSSGQWFIKDVKSSSGTFLNHVRLSPPGQESRLFPVNDGDVVQLGIDFKGGEEVIYRCVKMRVECNRGWQKALNAYNTTAHKNLLRSTGISSNSRGSDAGSVSSSECSICLNPVAPCQALFVAPCSHVWHYKCVRDLIQRRHFSCPNCRLISDLDADVEPPEGCFDQVENGQPAQNEGESEPADETQAGAATEAPNDPPVNRAAASSPPRDLLSNTVVAPVRSGTPMTTETFALSAGVLDGGPMTPRNDFGPFVLDSRMQSMIPDDENPPAGSS